MSHSYSFRSRSYAALGAMLLAGLALVGCDRESPGPHGLQPEVSPEAVAPGDVPAPAHHDSHDEPEPSSATPASPAAIDSLVPVTVPLGSRANCLVPGNDGPTVPERLLEADWKLEVEQRITDVHAAAGIVLVELEENGLRAVDAETGSTLWEERELPEHAEALVVDGRILVRDPDEWSFSALAPASGKILWTRGLGAPAHDLIACPSHRVAVATHRGHVDGGRDQTLHASGFDWVDGKHLWSVQLPGARVAATGDSIFVQRLGPMTGTMARIDCATSVVSPVAWMDGLELPGPVDTRYADVLDTMHFEGVSVRSDAGRLVCFAPPGASTPHCIDPMDGTVGRHVLVKDGIVYYAVRRPTEEDRAWVQRLVAWKPGEGRLWESIQGGLDHQVLDGGSTLVLESTSRVLFLDPRTSEVMACLPTADVHDATLLVDGSHLYLYMNRPEAEYRPAPPAHVLAAVRLPSPGVPPRSPIPVEPVAGSPMPTPTSKGGLALREVSSFRAHPTRGMSSGMMTDGTIEDLAFVDSEHLVVGGNDNHLGLYRFLSGRQVSRTKGGTKDLRIVESCGDARVAASTIVPETLLFERKGRRFELEHRISGEALGWLEGCEQLLVARDHSIAVVEAGSARDRASASFGGIPGGILHASNGRVIVDRGTGFELLEMTAEGLSSARPIAVPPNDSDGGELTQVWLAVGDTVVREYCSDVRCAVELTSLDGKVKDTWTFDVIGGPVAGLPSRIDVSPGGRFLLWRRKGLLPWLVDRTKGTEGLIALGSGPNDSGYQSAAFSGDESLLALGGHPRRHDVTVLELPR